MHLAQEAAGLVRVLFGDESGFTENPPLTQAWAPKGQPHAHEMKTGTRARLNGIGCCDFNLKPVSMWFKQGRVGGADFRAWGNALAAKCNPSVPTHLWLDNGNFSLTYGNARAIAALRMRVGSGAMALVKDTRSSKYSQNGIPSLRQVFFRLAKVSRH